MNRMLKALGAFALALALSVSLAATGLCAAAPGGQAPSAGYLVVLDQAPAQTLENVAQPAGLLGQATLFASFTEREELLPLAESAGIYKANDLADIQNLVWSGQVLSAEPDYQAELFALDPEDPAHPNDDYFVSSGNYQFNLKNVNVQSAWDAGLTGEGVTVAVIDSGLNVDHLDAPVKIARGRYYYYKEETGGRYEFVINGVTKYYNYYSSDYIMDNVGHGTMVSGIVAANTNNASGSYTGGVAGMAPNATIMPVRCFTNTDRHLGGYTSNLISGINYAMENGANIINMSWGIRTESSALKTAVTQAANAGCILIAAVGNDGSGTLQYPAAYDNVIGVGSTTKQGGLSSFSQRNDSVDVCAPGGSSGQQVYSLWYTATNAIGKGSGTSFSAPVVAGAAALMKEHDPTMTQADFLALLKRTSSLSLISAADRPYAGCGQMDIKKMLDVTGHTGATLRYNSDGSVTARAACHPAAGDSAPAQRALVLLGAYNKEGHLLDSITQLADLSGSFGSYAAHTTFQVPGAATVRAFFLSSTDLTAVTEPVAVELVR